MQHLTEQQPPAKLVWDFSLESIRGRRNDTFSERLILEIRALEEAINLQSTVYDTISRYEDAADTDPHENHRSSKSRQDSKKAREGLQGLLDKMIEIREARFVITPAPTTN